MEKQVAQGAGAARAPDLDAIEARAKAATPGPWDHGRFDQEGGDITWDVNIGGQTIAFVPEGTRPAREVMRARRDAEFIAAARADIPALVAEVRRLRKFAIECRDNFDCDPDAHRYDTFCRACEAAKVTGSGATS